MLSLVIKKSLDLDSVENTPQKIHAVHSQCLPGIVSSLHDKNKQSNKQQNEHLINAMRFGVWVGHGY